MNNSIQSLIVLSLVSVFNLELRADQATNPPKSPNVNRQPPTSFFNPTSTHSPFLNKSLFPNDPVVENRTPEEFASDLYYKLDSCKPSSIASMINAFSLITNNANQRNLKQPQTKESRDIENKVIAELNKKTAEASSKSDQNKGKTKDYEYWNNFKINQNIK